MTQSLLRPMAGPTSRPATLFRGKIYWRWVISTSGRFGVGPVYMRRRIWTNVDARRTNKARISTDVDFRRPILMSTIGRRVTRVRLYTRRRVRPYRIFVEDVCSGSIYSNVSNRLTSTVQLQQFNCLTWHPLGLLQAPPWAPASFRRWRKDLIRGRGPGVGHSLRPDPGDPGPWARRRALTAAGFGVTVGLDSDPRALLA
jgi:hypothetical protein